ncbi:MAG TPA: hypothetical protein VL171_07870 [Verrucomicrobiae bacterium]|nr:hypothetical protein [Verrucomicrobiae bacterium]
MKARDFSRTGLGECYVYTKSSGRFYGEPLTKVGPIHYSELGDFRLTIRWRTNDPAKLQELHTAVLKAVKEPGVAETFLEIKAIMCARRKALDKDFTCHLVNDKSVRLFAETASLRREEIELIASSLKGVS